MAWDLYGSDLPDAAKGYLSLLGSCGDERQAMAEAGVTELQVTRWARLDEFVENRSRALEHFQGWNRPADRDFDPFRTPGRGRRMDDYFDPWRVTR